MKKIISSIAPFLFLAALVLSMNSLKHVNTLDLVEKTKIEEHLLMFEQESQIATELNDERRSTNNEQVLNQQ